MYCSGKNETELANDVWAMRIIYQKVADAMHEASRLELQRIAEEKIDNGSLSFDDLKGAVVRAARKCYKATPAALIPVSEATINAAMTSASTEKEVNRSTHQVAFRAPRNADRDLRSHRRQREDRTCYYCNKKGHLKRHCFKLQRNSEADWGNARPGESSFSSTNSRGNVREASDPPGRRL